MPTARRSDPITLLKAIADPGRLTMARLLLEGAFNVTELTEILDGHQSTVSRHLRILVDAGLARGRREGREIYYAWEAGLDPSARALRDWIAAHSPELGDASRRRLAVAWERRRDRTTAFFSTVDAADPAAAWLGSPDCLPALVGAVPAGAVVADVGTGTGRLLPDLRARTPHVIGVDASSEMLGQARARLDAQGIKDVDLRIGDMAHLPLQDGEADAVVVNMALHHAPEPAVVLRELHRVLAPGGVLLIGDFLPHDEEWMRDKLADQWLGFSADDLSHWLIAAGFADVTIAPLPSEKPGSLDVFVARAVRRALPAHPPVTQPRAGA